MTAKCWANVLGGCDKISHEHVVSRGVIRGDCDCPVVSDGKHSTPRGRLGVDRMTSKILCKRHNRALSEVDNEAKRLMDFMGEATAPGHRDDIVLNGYLIERWALKTAVNLLAAGWADTKKWRPDRETVECAFGKAPWPSDMHGLWSVDCDSSGVQGPRSFHDTPLFYAMPDGTRGPVAGFLFRLEGMLLLLAMKSNTVEMLKCHPIDLGFGWSSELTYHYRPGAIAIGRPDDSVVRVRFEWPGRTR